MSDAVMVPRELAFKCRQAFAGLRDSARYAGLVHGLDDALDAAAPALAASTPVGGWEDEAVRLLRTINRECDIGRYEADVLSIIDRRAAPPSPSVSIGSRPQEAVSTEGHGADALVPPAVAHLWEYQEQLDADGVMVAVSRQALDETLQKHLALIDVLTFCRDSMVAYGDGACGRNCEAMTEGPQFADEIASINAVLVDQPRPDRSPAPTTGAANLAEALTWVLPLAKGYAAGRDVAANQRIIQNAEEILAAHAKGTIDHQIEMAVARTTLNRAGLQQPADGCSSNEGADGWIEWNGGENPVPGRIVEWRNRSGMESTVLSDSLSGWQWPHVVGPQNDIIAYRILPQTEKGL